MPVSEAFPDLSHECRREVLGPELRFYMIVWADSFSNRVYTWVFWSHDVKRRLNSPVMESEQRAIIKFLTNESVDTHKIRMKLHARFGEEIYALNRIQFWMHKIQRGWEDLHDEYHFGRPALGYIETKHASRLEKVPFESARSIV